MSVIIRFGAIPCFFRTLFLQKTGQQSLGSLGVAAVLDDFVKHIPVLIDGPP